MARGALWRESWGQSYPMCATCWDSSRQVAVKYRPGLVVFDATRGGGGPGQRSEPADHHHDEREDQQLVALDGVDERSYTSGTTGRPKGVVYTHRSAFLHSLAVSSDAGMSIGPQDCAPAVGPTERRGQHRLGREPGCIQNKPASLGRSYG